MVTGGSGTIRLPVLSHHVSVPADASRSFSTVECLFRDGHVTDRNSVWVRTARYPVLGRWRCVAVAILELAIGFFVLALLAGVLGAGGIAGLSMDIAKWLVVAFVVLAILSLVWPG